MTIDPDEYAKNRDIVEALGKYAAAKLAYTTAKKMAEADLARVARGTAITFAEDRMMRAAVGDAEFWIERLRELVEVPG